MWLLPALLLSPTRRTTGAASLLQRSHRRGPRNRMATETPGTGLLAARRSSFVAGDGRLRQQCEAKDLRRSARLVGDDVICCMSMEPPLQEQHAGPRPTSRSHEAYRIAKRPRPAVLAPWGRRIASPIVACWSWFRREREIRAAIAAWESLDDWMLRDIGVPRGRIEHIVRHGEYR